MFSDDFLTIQKKWINKQPLADIQDIDFEFDTELVQFEDNEEQPLFIESENRLPQQPIPVQKNIESAEIKTAEKKIAEKYYTQENHITAVQHPAEPETVIEEEKQELPVKARQIEPPARPVIKKTSAVAIMKKMNDEPDADEPSESIEKQKRSDINISDTLKSKEENSNAQNTEKKPFKYRIISLLLILTAGFIVLAYGAYFFSARISDDLTQFDKAENLFKQQKYPEAIIEFQKYYAVAETQSDKIKTLYHIAVSYYELKNVSQAFIFFTKITDTEDTGKYCAHAHYIKGEILREERKYLEAVDEYYYALKIARTDQMKLDCYKNIIEIYIEIEKWELVIENSDKLISFEGSNKNGSVFYYYALAYGKMNYTELARKYYNLLIQSAEFDSQYRSFAREQLEMLNISETKNE